MLHPLEAIHSRYRLLCSTRRTRSAYECGLVSPAKGGPFAGEGGTFLLGLSHWPEGIFRRHNLEQKWPMLLTSLAIIIHSNMQYPCHTLNLENFAHGMQCSIMITCYSPSYWPAAGSIDVDHHQIIFFKWKVVNVKSSTSFHPPLHLILQITYTISTQIWKFQNYSIKS